MELHQDYQWNLNQVPSQMHHTISQPSLQGEVSSVPILLTQTRARRHVRDVASALGGVTALNRRMLLVPPPTRFVQS